MNTKCTELVNYNDIKNQIKPFDLIAFRGGDLVSDLISYLEKYQLSCDDFTHVGLVVTSDILDIPDFKLDKDELYLLESTFSFFPSITHAIPDVTTGQAKFGVQLKKLNEAIPNYIYNDKTKVAWCRLLNNPYDDIQNKLHLKQQMSEFYKQYHNTLYDMDPLDLLGSMFTTCRGLRDFKDKVCHKIWNKCKNLNQYNNPALWQFCSELVASIYQLIGIIPKDVNIKNVLPMDFFGYDQDGLEALVDQPVYIHDF